MSNDALNSLLREYEQKKLDAELDLEKRKQTLYKLIPRLEEIDSELSKLGISTAKNILNNVSYFLLLAKTSVSYPSALTYIFIGIRINFTKTFSIPSILNNSSGSLFVLSLNKFISSRNTLLTLSIFSLNISILFTVISASNFLSLLYTTLSIN